MSLPVQRQRLEAFVASRRWSLDFLFVEAGASGRNDDRPKFIEMMRAVEAGRVDVVVIPKIDRLGRSFTDMAAAKDRIERAGARIVAMDLDADLSTPVGLMIWANLTIVAEMESRNIGERVSAVAETRTRSGKVYGGPPLDGYRVAASGGGWELDPVRAPIIRRIFEAAAAGVSSTRIAKDLNRDGMLAPRGGYWQHANIGRLLRSPNYYGAVWFKGVIVCEQGYHPPLVTRELWDRAQAARAVRKQSSSGGSGRPSKAGHLLQRGLLRCGWCGDAMRARAHIGGGGAYFCARRLNHEDGCAMRPVSRDVLDGAIIDFFNSVGLDVAATRAAFAQHHDRVIGEAVAASEGADRDCATAEERLARVRRHFQDGKLDADDWREQRIDLTAERDAAQANAGRCRARVEQATAARELRDIEEDVLQRLAKLRDSVAQDVATAADRDAVRNALTRLFEGFIIHDMSIGDDPPLQGLVEPIGDGGERPLWIEPLVRAEALEGVESYFTDGWQRPVLTRTALALEQSVQAG